MSILGYSTSYFLPEYWANTPLYGEKLIPLMDYILSVDYEKTSSLASAYYAITDKYRNVGQLPVEYLEALVEENGYSYVSDLLVDDEESLRLLVNLIVLIHELKGTKTGIELVLSLLKDTNENVLVMQVVGNPTIDESTKEVSNITTSDFLIFGGLNASSNSFTIKYHIRTPSTFGVEQCIASVGNKGFYIGINVAGRLVLKLSSNRMTWDLADSVMSEKLLRANTNYDIRLVYDGYEYRLDVSTGGDVESDYSTYISVDSSTPLNITNAAMYIGVDGTTTTIASPFNGTINFSNLVVNVDEISITQWFEQMPVGEENTFLISTNLDIDLVSSKFFSNFANFIKNYVYPSLQSFTAKLKFKGSLTFLPYIREKVTYVASSDVRIRQNFLVKTDEESEEATDIFKVKNDLDQSLYNIFKVLAEADTTIDENGIITTPARINYVGIIKVDATINDEGIITL